MPSLIALLALGVAVLLHELGHLIGGALVRLRPRKVALGFGPPLIKLVRGESRYSLGAFPLGAAVELEGMNPHAATEATASAGKRLFVWLCGPLGNVLFALVILFFLYLGGTHVAVPLTVGVVEPGSEAAHAQLRPGDAIVSIDGQAPSSWSELARAIEDHPGEKLALAVRRVDGKTDTLTVTPSTDRDGRGRLGIEQQYVFQKLPAREALRHALTHGMHAAWESIRLGLDLFHRRGAFVTPTSLVRTTSSAAASGWDSLVRVIATLSIALGLFHLLPLPSLDGSRVLFTAIEAATGRRVPPALETTIHALGFLALLSLIGLVAYRDVAHVIRLARGG